MIFGLKNVGAIYQKFVNTMLVDKLGKIMGVYVDNMVVKTGIGKCHIDDSKDLFTR